MKIIGNIIWLIFGGFHIALEYFFASFVLMVTIIGIPFGLQSLNLDIPDSHILWSLTLHHHHWYPLWEDALPIGKIGLFTIRKGGHIT